MLSLARFNICFTPSLRMFILTCFAMILFIRLGFWQLERAHEKKQLLQLSHQQALLRPIHWKPGDVLPKQFQLLHLNGYFLPLTLLLDNQHVNHQLGYDVISPLMLSNGAVVLVDRGWVKRGQQRERLPAIAVPKGAIQCLGNAYYPAPNQFVLGQVIEKVNDNSSIIESIKVPVISQFLHKSVYPFIIRQHPSTPHGFIREWPVVSMPPARHYGYAVQWFAFALVTLIIFLGLNLKKLKP